MRETILLVDDEPNVLEGYKRQLRKLFSVQVATSGEEGLRILSTMGPVSVVVSDLHMPVMDGIQFLGKAAEQAPDTVRIMLTGNADVHSAINAVNEGQIFRFLTKPCEAASLARAIVDGVRQYRLVKAEQDLLQKTLLGSIKVLSDVLSLTNSAAFIRSSRISQYAKKVAGFLCVENLWECETAAMLSQIGCITLPEDIMRKVLRGQSLDKNEAILFSDHPDLASELVAHIPRLEGVARIIAYQEKLFNGQGFPEDPVAGEDIPLGSRILKVALDFDSLVSSGHSKGKALAELRTREGFYDPGILDALDNVLGFEAKFDVIEVGVYGLEEEMILAEDIITMAGNKILLTKGQAISTTMIQTVKNYKRVLGVREPIKVMVPLSAQESRVCNV